MKAHGFGATDVGRKRSRNEDSMLVSDELGLYVVSDGMGGHARGDRASAIAVDVVRGHVQAHAELQRNVANGEALPSELVEVAKGAVEAACAAVYGEATSSPQYAGMGCTLSLLIFAGRHVAMAHVGDTRVYLARQGRLDQLSTDHTLVRELLQSGLVTEADIAGNPYEHVLTRAVGTQPSVQVDTLGIEVLPDDRFLMCSDGLTNYVKDERWLTERIATSEPDAIVHELVEFANRSGGEDNITVVALEIDLDELEANEAAELARRIEARMDALSAVFLFEGLDFGVLTRLLSACETVRLARDDTLMKEGELVDSMYIVETGTLMLTRDGELVGELFPGDCAAITTLLHPRQARATVVADEACTVLKLSRQSLRALLLGRPWLGMGLLEKFARRLSADFDRIVDPARNRESVILDPERL